MRLTLCDAVIHAVSMWAKREEQTAHGMDGDPFGRLGRRIIKEEGDRNPSSLIALSFRPLSLGTQRKWTYKHQTNLAISGNGSTVRFKMPFKYAISIP